jgi:hypothetical protein
MENRNIFAEAKTLDDQERHLTVEMPISRKAHVDREREKTPTKNIKSKPEQLKFSKTDPSMWL